MRPERIGDNLVEIPGWSVESAEEAIIRVYHFPGYSQVLAFVDDVTELSQKAQHYPTVEIGVTQVKIRLTTPAADGLTEVDFDLAKMFDHLADSVLGFE